jgi:hypothetical protein
MEKRSSEEIAEALWLCSDASSFVTGLLLRRWRLRRPVTPDSG